MKTKSMIAATVLAILAAPACAETSGIPPGMQFWLQPMATIVKAKVSWIDRLVENHWRGMVVPSPDPSAMAIVRVEMSGVPREFHFWLVQPTVPAADASLVRPSRTTTGAGW